GGGPLRLQRICASVARLRATEGLRLLKRSLCAAGSPLSGRPLPQTRRSQPQTGHALTVRPIGIGILAGPGSAISPLKSYELLLQGRSRRDSAVPRFDFVVSKAGRGKGSVRNQVRAGGQSRCGGGRP